MAPNFSAPEDQLACKLGYVLERLHGLLGAVLHQRTPQVLGFEALWHVSWALRLQKALGVGASMPAPAWHADAAHYAVDERRRRTCRRCGSNIKCGEPEFPIEGTGRMHLPCAQVPSRPHFALASLPDLTLPCFLSCMQVVHNTLCVVGQAHCDDMGLPLVAPVCKHWRRTGACAFQSRCFFRHPEAARAAAQPSRQARKPSTEDDAMRAARAAAWRAWNTSRARQTLTNLHPSLLAVALEKPVSGCASGAAGRGAAGQFLGTAGPGGTPPASPGTAAKPGLAPASSAGAPGPRQGAERSSRRVTGKRVRNAFRSGVFRRCEAFAVYRHHSCHCLCDVQSLAHMQMSRRRSSNGDVTCMFPLLPSGLKNMTRRASQRIPAQPCWPPLT